MNDTPSIVPYSAVRVDPCQAVERRFASASARNGERTQPVKSRISTIDRCRAPARVMSRTDPAAPATSATRATVRSPLLAGTARRSRPGDVGLAAQHSAVLDDQPGRDDVAQQHAGRLNLDALRHGDVAL